MDTFFGAAALAALFGGVGGFLAQLLLARYQAKVAYEYDARKALHSTIGPLRWQLLLAARDVERRISGHIGIQWDTGPGQYYGRSLVYRLLRPLAVCQLVQRHLSYADFSVDKKTRDLLVFETAAHRMLVGGDPLPFYEGLDFSTQSQHVFRDNLGAARVGDPDR